MKLLRLLPIIALLGLTSGTIFNNGTIIRNSGAWTGSSITFGVRSGVTLDQALPTLGGITRRLIPSLNKGVGGDTSTGMLARFESDILAFHPAMVSIEACYNDPGAAITVPTCTANVTAMIQKAQASGARVTLWVPTFSCTPALDSSIAPYRTAIRGLAVTFSTDLFDTYNDFVALPGATQSTYIMGDCQHFFPAGLAWMQSLIGTGAYANSFLPAAGL
jgi:hypothetical protein